jgi:hypothetical protein
MVPTPHRSECGRGESRGHPGTPAQARARAESRLARLSDDASTAQHPVAFSADSAEAITVTMIGSPGALSAYAQPWDDSGTFARSRSTTGRRR